MTDMQHFLRASSSGMTARSYSVSEPVEHPATRASFGASAAITKDQTLDTYVHDHEKEAQNMADDSGSTSSTSSASQTSSSPSISEPIHHQSSSSGTGVLPIQGHLVLFPCSSRHSAIEETQHEKKLGGAGMVDRLTESSLCSYVSCSKNEKAEEDNAGGAEEEQGQIGTLLLAAYPESSIFQHHNLEPKQEQHLAAADHPIISVSSSKAPEPKTSAKASSSPPQAHAPRKRGRIPSFALAELPRLPDWDSEPATKKLVSTSAVLQSLSPPPLCVTPLRHTLRRVKRSDDMVAIAAADVSSPTAASACSSSPAPTTKKTRRELPVPISMVPIKQESDDDAGSDNKKMHGRSFSFSSTSSLYSTKTNGPAKWTKKPTDGLAALTQAGEAKKGQTVVLRSRKSFDRLSRLLLAGVVKGKSAFNWNEGSCGVEVDSSRPRVIRKHEEEADDDEIVDWAAFLRSDDGLGDGKKGRTLATLDTDYASFEWKSETGPGNLYSPSEGRRTQAIPRRKSLSLLIATSSTTFGHAFSSRLGSGSVKRIDRVDKKVLGRKATGGWTPVAAVSARSRTFSEASWGDSPMAAREKDSDKSTATGDEQNGSIRVVGHYTTHHGHPGPRLPSRYEQPLRLLKHGIAWGAMKRTTTTSSSTASVQVRTISHPYPYHHQHVPSLCETSRLSDQSNTTTETVTASHPSSSMSMTYHERIATPSLSARGMALSVAENDEAGRETARLETLARLEGRVSEDAVARGDEKPLVYEGGWIRGLAFATPVAAV
ncbi:hypothetical protein QFC22_001184 [Naganishia vaughanmartiniae]|uniref:Uncharacterized protein n=1 Tax=Naganishia vaughanmartiniae TaxID=1424756 RepID=A0ACC2XLR3_9TREE|nr:hypothetical protein QFC22_001184 [Naganishia vaughanmartiniae]